MTGILWATQQLGPSLAERGACHGEYYLGKQLPPA